MDLINVVNSHVLLRSMTFKYRLLSITELLLLHAMHDFKID